MGEFKAILTHINISGKDKDIFTRSKLLNSTQQV